MHYHKIPPIDIDRNRNSFDKLLVIADKSGSEVKLFEEKKYPFDTLKPCIIMKNILLIVAFCFSNLSHLFADPSKAVICGRAIPSMDSTITLDRLMNNPITGRAPQESYVVTVEEDSSFFLEVITPRLTTGRLLIGNRSYEIVLFPGDSIFVQAQEEDVVFSGVGGYKNTFLKEIAELGLNDAGIAPQFNDRALSLPGFLEFMKNVKDGRIKHLRENERLLEPSFRHYFESETEVIYINLLQNYPYYWAKGQGLEPDTLTLPAGYRNVCRLSSVLKDQYTVLPRYTTILRRALYESAQHLKLKTSSLSMEDAMQKVIMDSLKGDSKEYYLTSSVFFGLKFERRDSIMERMFRTEVKDTFYLKTIATVLDNKAKFERFIGAALPEECRQTVLCNPSGTEMSFGEVLAKGKGKIIYLDIWSVTCPPCLKAMPYLDTLQQSLKELPIEFVFITIDPERLGSWERIFSLVPSPQNQYRFKSGLQAKLLHFFEIDYIPEYMIFDKEGKLLDYRAMSPASLEKGDDSLLLLLKKLATS